MASTTIRRVRVNREMKTYVTTFTTDRMTNRDGRWYETLKVWWCRLFHRRRSYSMPSAGFNLEWDIDCMRPGCNCAYTIITPNTPQHVTPFRVDKTRPKSWREHDEQNYH